MWPFAPKNPVWILAGTAIDSALGGGKFEIEGVDVWQYPWQEIEGDAVVQDPIYRRTFHFGVYRVEADGQVIEFAAGEFSNGVWGFYVRRNTA